MQSLILNHKHVLVSEMRIINHMIVQAYFETKKSNARDVIDLGR